MAQPWKKGALLASAALAGFIMMQGGTAKADVNMLISASVAAGATETVTTEMDFGAISLNPAGDAITLNASVLGAAAVPVGATNGSAVVGGNPGLITITGSSDFDVTVTYPGDAAHQVSGPTNATQVFITGIGANSTPAAALLHTGGNPTELYVGGVIDLPGDAEEGIYSGNIDIALVYAAATP